MRKWFLLVCVLTVMAAGALDAANWPQWRGPELNGSSPETDLPTEFGPDRNVAWKAALPGRGGCTPIVWEDRVFISAQDGDKKTWAMCLSVEDGSVMWKHQVGTGFTNRQGNTACSPSPVTNGEWVVFFYGNGDLVAFDMAGKEMWSRNLQEDHGEWEYLWNYGASGLLHDGKLYIPVLHGNMKSGPPDKPRSYLLCVDPKTGEDLWKHMRPSDAGYECKQAYTTPIPITHEGKTQILIHGADHVTGHSPKDGHELWRSPTYNPGDSKWYRTVSSPVYADGMVLVSAARGNGLFAIEPGTEEWAWTERRGSPDVPTALVYKNDFYVLADKSKRLLRIEPQTGEMLEECQLGGRSMIQASPTGADGRIYCMNMNGKAFVVDARDKMEVIHAVEMGGRGCRSTISVSNGKLFIRAQDTLYCVGKKG